MSENLIWFENLGIDDVARVGGKNASLGEMISNLSSLGIIVPSGFATTSEAFHHFLDFNQLTEKIHKKLSQVSEKDIVAIQKAGSTIREWVEQANFSDDFINDVETAYQQLTSKFGDSSFAVRSSATAEDLPDASFAGQQETYLNIHGLDNLLLAIKKVFASLYNDRAISYRIHQGFSHTDIALSAGIQKMIRSDLAASGVMFSLDTESGFDKVVFITSSYGLGEMVVQGAVNPDEFYVYKPALANNKDAIIQSRLGGKAIKMIFGSGTDTRTATQTVDVPTEEQQQFSINEDEIHKLAQFATIIESHYQKPMDIEWAKDGLDQHLYIVQARPETVQSQANKHVLQRYELTSKGEIIITGRSIGQRIGVGT
ncbi:PEP/pyruvate-binding domain-containing protein, partial [Kaarinaea lacus]